MSDEQSIADNRKIAFAILKKLGITVDRWAS
jgi:hypothetical protein